MMMMMNEITLSVEKKDRNIAYMNNEGCITDLAFLVMATGNLDNLNKAIRSLPKCATTSRPSNSSLDCG
jgi:hypothetical protein